ncbi:hypothetical protein HDU76_001208 [Blyttiomyces sp. JEL0837]|nr:hypothetical protein HDU76_001208 [Blyttiomyces sp. JEL0837]
MAAQRGYLDIIQFILTKVDVNESTSNDQNQQQYQPVNDANLAIDNDARSTKSTLIKSVTTQAIYRAFKNGHLEIIKVLLSLPNNDPTLKQAETESVLCEAVKYPDVLMYLLTEIPGVDVLNFALSALVYASDVGDIESLQFLLSAFPDISANQSYSRYQKQALEKAARQGRVDVVTLLLDHCGNISHKLALEEAARKGHLSVVKLLFNHCGNVNLNSAVAYSAEAGCFEVVKYLIKLPRIHGRVDESWALTLAVKEKHYDTAKFLAIRDGVNVGVEDSFALRKVAEQGSLEMVKFLVGFSGVDPTARNNEAVRMASSKGHEEVVKFLLTLPGVSMS